MNKIVKGVLGFGIGTALSRGFGFFREVVLAYLFGAGFEMDAFRVAFRIPNLLRDMLGEGTLTPAFMPIFGEHRRKKKDKGREFIARLIGVMILITGIISVIGIIFSPLWVKGICYGFKGEKFHLTVKLVRIMFPFLIFISIGAIVMGVLNFFHHFFITGIAPCCFNIAIIGCGICFARQLGIFSIAVGAVIGGVFQLVIQLPWLKKSGYFSLPSIKFTPTIKKVFKLMTPIALGYGAFKINTIVNTLIASFMGEGVISWLSYAFVLMWIPVGVIGVALANVTLSYEVEELVDKRREEFKKTLYQGLLYGFLVSSVITLGLWVFAHPICKIVYERGNFTSYDTYNTATLLKYYSLGVPGLVLVKVLTTGYYALKKTTTPMVISFITVGTNLVLVLSLVKIMNYEGIPLGISLANILNAIMLGVKIFPTIKKSV